MKLFKRPVQLYRLVQINFILFRNRFDTVMFSTEALQPYSFLSYLNPWRWFGKKTPRGVALRTSLEDLGPVFVKFGQILSTRRDLLPEDIADELEKLQSLSASGPHRGPGRPRDGVPAAQTRREPARRSPSRSAAPTRPSGSRAELSAPRRSRPGHRPPQ